jgi:hypothetical protein
VERNEALVQEDLSRWFMTKDLLGWYAQDHEPSNYTGDYLRDPRTHVWFHYHIIIGRRVIATREVRRKMNQFSGGGYIRIGTYDRFVDIAANFDRRSANPNESVYLPNTQDESDQAW